MASVKVFSKLDLKKGFFHIQLDKESRKYITTATPIGLHQYKRLPMGLTDSSSVFPRSIQQLLSDLPGVIAYIDDIIVFGEDEATHNARV